ncbi:hypothetical protein Nepgr_026396 [Nepenthes gracilis]|uniref:Uncharacterized protein n=1 Tax=Nepenthes gracilis TaxID=150966 RepID=A0AAD3Y0I6_NEPGR|nr:hypothetical protein Nepgr_026396 [Nepenthes gracilis]
MHRILILGITVSHIRIVFISRMPGFVIRLWFSALTSSFPLPYSGACIEKGNEDNMKLIFSKSQCQRRVAGAGGGV